MKAASQFIPAMKHFRLGVKHLSTYGPFCSEFEMKRALLLLKRKMKVNISRMESVTLIYEVPVTESCSYVNGASFMFTKCPHISSFASLELSTTILYLFQHNVDAIPCFQKCNRPFCVQLIRYYNFVF